MNVTAEEVLDLSDDVDAGEGDDGTVSPTPATVPKKRGRPANNEKPKKAVTSNPGRGRGRPAKGAESSVNKKQVKAAMSADGSEEEGTGSENDDSPVNNGDAAEVASVIASKRGRKPKAKRKLSHTIEATGKGRGRPKKIAKTDNGEDEDEVGDEIEDGASSDYKPGKKAAKAAKKGRGRPKKVNSDDESSDDKEERRPVGRPPSGGINLNIVRTGKGQGRPKKAIAAKRAAAAEKKATESENSSNQRGRPSTSGKGVYIPTGKPRGRPKAVQDKDSQNEDDDDAEVKSSVVTENSAEDVNETDKESGND